MDAIPFPVALLARRARNAKSTKDRHDTAYYAWEASLRLAAARVAGRTDAPAVARPSIGHWAQLAQVDDRPREAPPLLAVYRLFADASPRSITPRRLVDAIPAYRNAVLGHGSTRAPSYYEEASALLLDGLIAAWKEDVFFRRADRLLFVEDVMLDPDGARRARLVDLSAAVPTIEDPRGTSVPADVLPGRIYLRSDGGLQPLHPWLLYHEVDLRERALFFNSFRQGPEYLDYASGEVLARRELEAAFPGIGAEVEALLHLQTAVEAPAEKPDPDLFAGYRLLRRIGEGGMGVVHLARQESLGRLVAIKLLPGALADDATAIARFEREVRALARCDHPNVVKILASGCERGTPYYAMELVEGTDLADVARALSPDTDLATALATATERRRRAEEDVAEAVPPAPPPSTQISTRARDRPRDRPLEIAVLFRDAALGLHHLHENGIVHRDVKPANLMVTADRRVVVMDLGLALVGDASRTITRDAGSVLGTLRYMPPEQLQRNLVQVDRRADVYSLGATFYELLAVRPFLDGESEARLIQQVLRESPMPPRKANPAIPADLATIVVKATDKDPARRYPTALALAEDLDAFLAGRPIAARPATLGYVVRLAARRHRALALTVAAGVALLAVGTGLFVWRLDISRRAAIAERARAEDLVDFLLRDLSEGLESVRRLDLLDQVTAKTRAYYDSLPQGGIEPETLRRRALTLQNLGSVLGRQGKSAEALVATREALGLAQRLAEQEPTPGRRADLAEAHMLVGGTLEAVGRKKEATAEYRTALDLREELAKGQPGSVRNADLAEAHDQLGRMLFRGGQTKQGWTHTERALALRERLAEASPGDSKAQADVARSHVAMAYLMFAKGQTAQAIAEHRAALSIRRHLVEEHPQDGRWMDSLAWSHDGVGQMLLSAGRSEEASTALREAVQARERLVAMDPTNRAARVDLARSSGGWAGALIQLGDYETGFRELRRSTAMLEDLVRMDPSDVPTRTTLAIRRLNFAQALVLHTQREDGEPKALEEAGAQARTSIELCREQLRTAPGDLRVLQTLADALSILGEAQLLRDEAMEALASEREATALYEQLRTRDPLSAVYARSSAWVHVLLGRALAASGDREGARESWRRAVALNGARSADPSNLEAFDNQAQALLELGDIDAARPFVQALVDGGLAYPNLLRLARKNGLVVEPRTRP